MKRTSVTATLVCLLAALAAGRSRAADGQALLREAGVTGGLVVHLGCGDGKLTAALCASQRYVVHGLDTDPKAVAAARKRFAAAGLCGRVSADVFDGRHLPYVDNLVNLLVADELGGVPMAEAMRVLAPRGVAMIGGKKTVKPWPNDIDEWTHFLHDPSGNAVAKDRRVGNPHGLQWTAGPKHTRDHDAMASMSAMTTSAGRLFYIFDEGHTSLIHRPPKWRLVARDAFNGVLLWKRDIPNWVTHLWYFRTGPAQLPRRLVSVGDRVYVTLGLEAPVSELDAATGQTLRVFKGSEKTEEIVCHQGTLLTVKNEPALLDDEAPKVFGYWELSVKRKPAAAKSIVAYDLASGNVRWKKTGDNLAWLAPLSLCALGDRVFFLDNESLHCLRLDDGREVWKASFATEGLFLRGYAPTVVAADGVVMCLAWDKLRAFAIEDGRKLWENKGALDFASPGDLFVINGIAWVNPHTAAIWKDNRIGRDGKITSGIPIPRENFLGNGGKEIWGINIHTGEVKKALPRAKVLPGGHHARCYRNKATVRYLVCGRRGLEFVDVAGGNNVNNWWVRGLCQYGILPANGFTYVPPDPCRCFNHIKLNGFLALSTASSLDAADPDAGPALERGPAYSEIASRKPQTQRPESQIANRKSQVQRLAWHPPIYPAKPDEWPTFRGNVTRSGSTTTRVPTRLKEAWRAAIGGNLSAPVAAGGRLWLASKDSFTVHCLDAATGRSIWQFVAGGRLLPAGVGRRAGLALPGRARGTTPGGRQPPGVPVARERERAGAGRRGVLRGGALVVPRWRNPPVRPRCVHREEAPSGKPRDHARAPRPQRAARRRRAGRRAGVGRSGCQHAAHAVRPRAEAAGPPPGGHALLVEGPARGRLVPPPDLAAWPLARPRSLPGPAHRLRRRARLWRDEPLHVAEAHAGNVAAQPRGPLPPEILQVQGQPVPHRREDRRRRKHRGHQAPRRRSRPTRQGHTAATSRQVVLRRAHPAAGDGACRRHAVPGGLARRRGHPREGWQAARPR